MWGKFFYVDYSSNESRNLPKPFLLPLILKRAVSCPYQRKYIQHSNADKNVDHSAIRPLEPAVLSNLDGSLTKNTSDCAGQSLLFIMKAICVFRKERPEGTFPLIVPEKSYQFFNTGKLVNIFVHIKCILLFSNIVNRHV